MDVDFVVCLDSWACVHLILPLLFPKPETWMLACNHRQDVPREAIGSITAKHFQYNTQFLSFLKSQTFRRLRKDDILRFFETHWVYDSDHSFFPHSNDYLLLPTELVRGQFPPKSLFVFLWPWFKLIQNDNVGYYWDPMEQISLVLKCNEVHQADAIHVLKPVLHGINDVSVLLQANPHGRFSFTAGRKYLAGPASLINHACKRHSNVVVDHK